MHHFLPFAGFDMPKKSKLLDKIDEKKLITLFVKYEEELETGGWRGNDSVWGKIVSELGLSNTERNRHLCYSTKQNELKKKRKFKDLLENKAVESPEEVTAPAPAIFSEAKGNIDHEQNPGDSNQQIVVEFDGSQIGRLSINENIEHMFLGVDRISSKVDEKSSESLFKELASIPAALSERQFDSTAGKEENEGSSQRVEIDFDQSKFGDIQNENPSIFEDVNDDDSVCIENPDIDADETNQKKETQPTESQTDINLSLPTNSNKGNPSSKSQFEVAYDINFSHSGSEHIDELMSDSDKVSPTGYANTTIKSDDGFSSFSSAANNDVEQGNIIIGSNMDTSQSSKISSSGNKNTDYIEYPKETTTKASIDISSQIFTVETEFSHVEKLSAPIETHASYESDFVRKQEKGMKKNVLRQERIGPIESDVSSNISDELGFGEISTDVQENDGNGNISVADGECYLS